MTRHLDRRFDAESERVRHITTARKLLPRSQRYVMGARIARIFSDLAASKAGTPAGRRYAAGGWMVIRTQGRTTRMWVVKKPVAGLRKGEQVHNRAKMEHYAAMGATFRTVRFPRSKEVRHALSAAARVMAPLHHECQFGFVPRRNCTESARRHAWAKTVYLLDIESAFDQVTSREVVEILNRVFMVNRRLANLIADLSTENGHLYQGSPIAPAVFNVRAMWMVERLHRLCEANGCTLTVYADDLCISSERWEYVSKRFQRTVLRIIRECGLKVNASKCKVRRVSPDKVGSFDITGLVIDYDPVTKLPHVRPIHRRRTLRKAEYLAHSGAQYTNELTASGGPKQLEQVVKGLEMWAETRGEPVTSHQDALNLAS